MEPVRHRRFSGCSLARHALQHWSDATSPACTDSVLLCALPLHCAHHTFGATEEIVSEHRERHHCRCVSTTRRRTDETARRFRTGATQDEGSLHLGTHVSQTNL